MRLGDIVQHNILREYGFVYKVQSEKYFVRFPGRSFAYVYTYQSPQMLKIISKAFRE